VKRAVVIAGKAAASLVYAVIIAALSQKLAVVLAALYGHDAASLAVTGAALAALPPLLVALWPRRRSAARRWKTYALGLAVGWGVAAAAQLGLQRVDLRSGMAVAFDQIQSWAWLLSLLGSLLVMRRRSAGYIPRRRSGRARRNGSGERDVPSSRSSYREVIHAQDSGEGPSGARVVDQRRRGA
jgi:hypothetical protein